MKHPNHDICEDHGENLDFYLDPAIKRHFSISHWDALGKSGFSPPPSDKKANSLPTQCQWRSDRDSELTL